jgi:hypothetical protein
MRPPIAIACAVQNDAALSPARGAPADFRKTTQRISKMATKAAEYKIKGAHLADDAECGEKALANRNESAHSKSMHNNSVGAELSDARRIDASAQRD